MKKNWKKVAVTVLTGALAIGGAMTVNAASLGDGQWCTGTGAEANRYWFTVAKDGSSCIANTWHWVKDADGVIRCYYFDKDGWVVTNTTVDGEKVDADGHWVDANGNVMTATEASKDFYAHNSNFINSASNTAATTTTTATTAKAGTKNVVKGSGKGDNPSGAQADQLGYELSTVNGYQVTNNWANFSIDFTSTGKKVSGNDAESGVDIEVGTDSVLVIRYVPLSSYAAGNTDMNAFLTAFNNDVRGAKGYTRAADVQLGAYTFHQFTKSIPHPRQQFTDHIYVRQVEGTNYAQIISVVQNGIEQDYLSALNTIAKVR